MAGQRMMSFSGPGTLSSCRKNRFLMPLMVARLHNLQMLQGVSVRKSRILRQLPEVFLSVASTVPISLAKKTVPCSGVGSQYVQRRLCSITAT